MPVESTSTNYNPTSLLLSCSNVFYRNHIPPSQSIVLSCMLPIQLKVAQVNPCIKKPSSDKYDSSNYHQISNLKTISKILERPFLSHILTHITSPLTLIHISQPITDPIALRLPSFSALIMCLKLSIDKSPLFWSS